MLQNAGVVVDANQMTTDDFTLFEEAILDDSIKIVKFLMPTANLERIDRFGRHIFFFMAFAEKNWREIASLLPKESQELKLLVNHPNNNGYYPLHREASVGNVDYCRFLVEEWGANVSATMGGKTAADFAQEPVLFLRDSKRNKFQH